MKTIYFDCYSGVSGDMILGALTDLGLDREAWLSNLSGLNLSGWEIEFSRVSRQHLDSQRVEVRHRDPQPERHLSEIEEIINSSRLPDTVKERSLAAFRCLGEAEAKVHGVSIERVHFHEVGAVDAIVDVVGACLALEMLGVDRVYSSPVGVGQGFAQAAHGMMPLPPPATCEILRGAPVRFTGVETELATPTGATLLKTLATFSPPPADLKLVATGYGAGKKVITHLPNVLRALLLESEPALETDQAILIETNIDNMNPEIYPHVIGRLLEAGAMDAYLIPIIMKKGRPGVVLSALASPDRQSTILDVLYRETSTLGVRMQRVGRFKLPRREVVVQTEFGPVQGKESRWENTVRLTPEFEDCRRVALEKNIPLKDVYEAFRRAAEASTNIK